MKNITRFFLILLFSFSFCTIASAEDSTEVTAISTKASDVFHSYTAYINPTRFAGDCALLGTGKGSIQIILQRKDSVNGWWFTYDRQNYTKSFSNTSVFIYGENYTLPAGSTFRCKTNVEATLNGKTDSKTVISPELTVY